MSSKDRRDLVVGPLRAENNLFRAQMSNIKESAVSVTANFVFIQKAAEFRTMKNLK